MNETDMRLLYLSHHPNEVRRRAYDRFYEPPPGALSSEGAHGRSLRGWALGLAAAAAVMVSLAQVL